MNTLILGGCGFIGRHVVQALAKYNIPLVVFDIDANPVYSARHCTYLAGDFSDTDKLDDLMTKYAITHVVHLVSTTLPKSSNDDMPYDIESNVIQTLRLLDLCLKHRVQRFLFMSSGGTVYGSPEEVPVSENHTNYPLCSYGISKLTIERYLHLYQQLYGLDYVVLRAANPYGPGQNPLSGQGVIANFVHKIYEHQSIEVWGDGTNVRDFFHVKDLAELVAVSLLSKHTGIFNAGSGEGTSINQIIEYLREIIDIPFNVVYKKKRHLDVQEIILNCSLAIKVFDWKPKISLTLGIKDYISIIHKNS